MNPGNEAADAGDGASVREATFELLRARGVTTVFGNPGSTELGFLRDFPPDFEYVMGLHEGVVVATADGFAQASGRPAFVNLHSACGVGNAMGAVVNAFHNRAPLVITAGNQDRRHLEREPYLYARSPELMQPYVKHSEQPARAQDVPLAIDRAWHLAQSPPAGPVFVSVPTDDWNAVAEPVVAGEFRFGGSVARSAVDQIAERVRQAASPVIVAGAGVDRDGAWEQTIELSQRLRAPVWAAPQSPRAGFPEDHALFAGHLAPGEAAAAAQLAGHDLGLVLGAPVFAFLPYQPSGPRMPDLIQVTDDPDEAARAPTRLSVVADTGSVVEGLLELLPAAEPWSGSTRRPAATPPPPAAGQPISAAFLMATLGELVAEDAVIVEESPSNRIEFRRHVPIRRPGGFYATASGGLGFAMPAAVGIKLADRSRPVVCLVGDGSALYAPQALWSAVSLRTPVAFVVVNNARYAILESAAQFGGLRGLPSFELPGVDFVSLAASLGCEAARVQDPALLRDALGRALASDAPYMLDVAIDPTIPPLLDEPALTPGKEAR